MAQWWCTVAIGEQMGGTGTCKKMPCVAEACVSFFERPCLYAGNLLSAIFFFDADSKNLYFGKGRLKRSTYEFNA